MPPKSPFSAPDLKRMATNPDCKGRMLDAYPFLLPISADDAFLRWLAWVYDPGSPLIKQYKDLRKRKEAAAELSGFSFETADPEIRNDGIRNFLQQVVKSMEWAVFCSKESLFWEYYSLLNEPIKTGSQVKDTDIIAAAQKKDTLAGFMQNIAQELPELRKSFFGDDQELAEEGPKVRTPEKMAGVKK